MGFSATLVTCIITTLQNGIPTTGAHFIAAGAALGLSLVTRSLMNVHQCTRPQALQNEMAALLHRHLASVSWLLQWYLLGIALVGGLNHMSIVLLTAWLVPTSIALVRGLAEMDWETGSPIWILACGLQQSGSKIEKTRSSVRNRKLNMAAKNVKKTKMGTYSETLHQKLDLPYPMGSTRAQPSHMYPLNINSAITTGFETPER
jgi:hypothetical protein